MGSLIFPLTGAKLTFLRDASRFDPPRFLSKGGLVPTRILPVVTAHVEPIVDHDRPYPCGRAVRYAILAERRDMQIVRLRDPPQFLLCPVAHILLIPLNTAPRQRLACFSSSP